MAESRYLVTVSEEKTTVEQILWLTPDMLSALRALVVKDGPMIERSAADLEGDFRAAAQGALLELNQQVRNPNTQSPNVVARMREDEPELGQ